MHKPDSPRQPSDWLEALTKKYGATGQDLSAYLEGLLYTDYGSYWDYIHLETLLSLQNPRTTFPDELIFITYHQVTELYFKMILWEMEQIGQKQDLTAGFFTKRVNRINRYVDILVQSFDVMGQGMEPEQFRKFRMALLPASGFQSVQFRMIEIRATELIHLTDAASRQTLPPDAPVAELYPHLAWRKGATELSTGKPTLTLQKFEEKYANVLLALAQEARQTNLWAAFTRLPQPQPPDSPAAQALRTFDESINIDWALAHFRSAMHYLHKDPEVIAATGGTNWQQYLPPVFQKRIFYPALWTVEEKENWGKTWVEKHVLVAPTHPPPKGKE